MRHCTNPNCPDRVKYNRIAEYEDKVTTCAECGEKLKKGPAPQLQDPSPQKDRTGLSARVIATIVLVGSCVLLGLMSLPGFQTKAAHTSSFLDWLQKKEQFSVIFMGLIPIVTAFSLVEIVLLIVPRWRDIRFSGEQGYKKRFTASMVVGILLILVQGWALAIFLTAHRPPQYSASSPLFFKLMILGAITMGTLTLLAIAGLIRQRGLGNGFSIILLLGIILGLQVQALKIKFAFTREVIAPINLLIIVGGIIFVLLATRWMLKRSTTIEIGKKKRPIHIPALSAGIGPILLATSLYIFVLTLRQYIEIPTSWDKYFVPKLWSIMTILVTVFTVLGVIIGTMLFQRLKNLKRLLPADSLSEEEMETFEKEVVKARWKHIWESSIYLVGMYLLFTYLNTIANPAFLTIPAIVLLTAIGMDILAEWRARSTFGEMESAWFLQRVYGIEMAKQVLEEYKIPSHARSVYHRTLLHFFGPHIPIEILVPKDKLKKAKEILSRNFLPKTENSE